jgi:hypothetical protein
LVVTGLKAWHCRSSTRFFTHTNLHVLLSSSSILPPSARTILFSAGEIDCREGIGGKILEGYYASSDDAVKSTTREFVKALRELANSYEKQVRNENDTHFFKLFKHLAVKQ